MDLSTVSCRASDRAGNPVPVRAETVFSDGVYTVTVKETDWTRVCAIDVGYDLTDGIRAGDDGYFVLPQSDKRGESYLTRFTERADYALTGDHIPVSVYGVRHPAGSFAAVVLGDVPYFRVTAGVRDGSYYLYAHFDVEGEPDELPCVAFRPLDWETADYSAIAGACREILLARQICRPLAERHNPALDYAKKSLYVRVRMAWKPVPSPVAEQTPENEPPLHVACTFDDVRLLMEECKRQGVEAAEFCLVGWNVSGHDGRWPQIFPVEPRLGGEEGLKKLIQRAEELGYTVGCHTNSTEMYRIADSYDESKALINADGEIVLDRHLWGGGRARKLCPAKALEFAETDLPRVRALGFNGTHYVDVLSIEKIASCHDPAHPLTRNGTVRAYREIAELCRGLFGGFASEGGMDVLAPVLDYGLYVTMGDPAAALPEFADEKIPLWQLVYHGIILSNPFATTVNLPLKSRFNQLKAYEYGARPTFYVYSKFNIDPAKDWMGTTDPLCATEEERRATAAMLKTEYDRFAPFAKLQECYMIRHERDGEIVKVTYSDGSVVTADYEKGTITVN